MRTRTTLALLALLLALGAVAMFSRGPRERGPDEAAGPVFPGLEASGVRRLRIDRPEGSVVLERDGPGWAVAAGDGEGRPADDAAVERALEAVAGLAGGTVVSTNPERRERYGLGEGAGLSCRLEDASGGTLAAFSVGRSGPDFASSYLVRAGEDSVLLVPADLRQLLGRTAEAWRDRRALGVGPEAITAVRVEHGGERLEIGRAEGRDGWTVDGRPAETAAVERYLDLLGNLRALAFASPGEESAAGFDRAEGTLSVETAGSTVDLVVGGLKEGSGQRYLRSSRFDEPLLVTAGVADALLKTAGDFPAPQPQEASEP